MTRSFFFFSSRRRHTRFDCDWSSDVCSSDLIVVGLGNVGTSVTGQLHDLGFDVVCIDNNPNAPGIPLARQLGLPVVIGDAFREETLRQASLDTCIALVSVTSSDIVNLETALNARALRDD